MPQITVNGQPRTIPDGHSVRDLVRTLGIPEDQVAVELNRKLLRGANYDRVLVEADQVEVVTLVGGG